MEPQGHQGGHYFCFPLCLIGLSSKQIGIPLLQRTTRTPGRTSFLFPLCRDELSSNQISLLITTENHKVIREHSVGVCPVGSVGSVLIQMCMYTTTVATENHNKRGHHSCFPLCLIGLSSNQIGLSSTT